MNQIVNKFPEIPSQCATILDILRDRSCNILHKQALTLLEDRETQELTLTSDELENFCTINSLANLIERKTTILVQY
ncbi:MAG: hypothetical protein RMY16_05790 [Nostoc sp. DedQUE12b]|uniref:hypothetical protein n=1 Tax=Nostoc sp. DedQUE12b TaxID=3075398 RepID=UPI002AD2DD24|nr:hypothetical protein [Nostoc sp. DedQUE12b]MDZ8085099.1 hypothetical protein [Nostoc sp. DedQUE12b]